MLPLAGSWTLGALLRARRRRSTCSPRSRCATSRGSTAAGRSRAPRSTSRCARPASSLARGARARAAPGDVRRLAAARASRRRSSRSRARLERYPALRFKLDPTTDWTRRADRRAGRDRRGRLGRLQGPLQGHGRRQPARPRPLPARGRGASRTPGSRTPASTDETRPVLEPHRDRITWDAPIHSIADIEALPFPPRMVNVKPSRFGGLQRAARRLRLLRRARHRRLRRRPVRARPGPRPDPVPRLAVPPRHAERRRARRLQRRRPAAGPARQPARAAPERDRLSLGVAPGAVRPAPACPTAGPGAARTGAPPARSR